MSSQTPRMSIEDTLGAILAALQDLVSAAARPGGSSSLDIEDMAKGPPKVTTHGSVGVPMSEEFVRARIAEHSLAHRLAEAEQKANWQATVEMATAGLSLEEMNKAAAAAVRKPGLEERFPNAVGLQHHAPGEVLEELPDFNVGPVVQS